jgi:hypothetical protein
MAYSQDDPNRRPKYPMSGDPGSTTKTWRTPEPRQRDWSKAGVMWLPPTYTEHSLTTAPLGAATATTRAPEAATTPVTGASMAPAFAAPPTRSDRSDINDMLGQQPETAFLQPGPSPTPTPTPVPRSALGAPAGPMGSSISALYDSLLKKKGSGYSFM